MSRKKKAVKVEEVEEVEEAATEVREELEELWRQHGIEELRGIEVELCRVLEGVKAYRHVDTPARQGEYPSTVSELVKVLEEAQSEWAAPLALWCQPNQIARRRQAAISVFVLLALSELDEGGG